MCPPCSSHLHLSAVGPVRAYARTSWLHAGLAAARLSIDVLARKTRLHIDTHHLSVAGLTLLSVQGNTDRVALLTSCVRHCAGVLQSTACYKRQDKPGSPSGEISPSGASSWSRWQGPTSRRKEESMVKGEEDNHIARSRTPSPAAIKFKLTKLGAMQPQDDGRGGCDLNLVAAQSQFGKSIVGKRLGKRVRRIHRCSGHCLASNMLELQPSWPIHLASEHEQCKYDCSRHPKPMSSWCGCMLDQQLGIVNRGGHMVLLRLALVLVWRVCVFADLVSHCSMVVVVRLQQQASMGSLFIPLRRCCVVLVWPFVAIGAVEERAFVAGLWRSVSHAPCVDQHDKPVALIMAPESKLLVAAMLIWGGDGRSNLVSAPASKVLRIGESRCYPHSATARLHRHRRRGARGRIVCRPIATATAAPTRARVARPKRLRQAWAAQAQHHSGAPQHRRHPCCAVRTSQPRHCRRSRRCRAHRAFEPPQLPEVQARLDKRNTPHALECMCARHCLQSRATWSNSGLCAACERTRNAMVRFWLARQLHPGLIHTDMPASGVFAHCTNVVPLWRLWRTHPLTTRSYSIYVGLQSFSFASLSTHSGV